MAQATKPKVKFILSVDTEEEWDWTGDFPQQNFSVANVQKIPEFQQNCESLGIKPTYFVDYAVANDNESVAILKQPLQQHHCQIAAHLHPWCNPPYFGVTGEFESHVVNLPIAQVEAKLVALTQKIKAQFGIQPNAFRTGRWGITGEVLKLLVSHGYEVDSSVYPYYQHQYFDCTGAPIAPYWPDYNQVNSTADQRDILQIPVTVGFNRKDFQRSNRLHQMLNQPKIQWARPVGIAWKLNLLRKYYLCPELSTSDEMINLCNVVLAQSQPVLHMYMHSSSLLANTTGLMANKQSINEINTRIKMVMEYLQEKADVECLTITEVADWFKQEQQ